MPRARPDDHRRPNALMALLAGLILLGCQPSRSFSVMMQDSAMEPTYLARQAIRFRAATMAGRGQVVAFEYPFPYPGRPRRELILRVIGLPGDRLELGPSGVLVNGQPLTEPYAKHQQQVWPARFDVPAGHYFLLGDDRNNQRDSRWWGPLPADKLLGITEPDGRAD